ncbi:MAG: nitrogenase component 1 [Treponema sp.]|jgi:hypothetical protein|nr:nitrogenase component 1 [Treponema sp.]
MARILLTLPPLSPDYSGIASVLHDLRALTILHDASGCTGTYTGYDEPRWFGSGSPVFCSGLREMDAILGDDERLLDKMEAALKDAPAPFAAIVGSPVPTLIGFDFQGFAALAEKRLGIPILGFPAAGFTYYDRGQKEAYLALANRFLDSRVKRQKKRVNLLGASALDGFNDSVLDRLLQILRDADLEAGAIWGARSGLGELAQSGKAAVNWVLTAAALPLARLLQERFGAPFVTGLPIGRAETERISGCLKNPEAASAAAYPAQWPRREAPEGEGDEKTRILIIGEAVFCNSLRAYLEKEDPAGTFGRREPSDFPSGTGNVRIATFFPEGRELLGKGDLLLESEDEARTALEEGSLETVFADPLFEGLLPKREEPRPRFIPVPHRAVSGRIYGAYEAPFGGPGFFSAPASPGSLSRL